MINFFQAHIKLHAIKNKIIIFWNYIDENQWIKKDFHVTTKNAIIITETFHSTLKKKKEEKKNRES